MRDLNILHNNVSHLLLSCMCGVRIGSTNIPLTLLGLSSVPWWKVAEILQPHQQPRKRKTFFRQLRLEFSPKILPELYDQLQILKPESVMVPSIPRSTPTLSSSFRFHGQPHPSPNSMSVPRNTRNLLKPNALSVLTCVVAVWYIACRY